MKNLEVILGNELTFSENPFGNEWGIQLSYHLLTPAPDPCPGAEADRKQTSS
uniref:Uncharacterized protein n=1 Tax=Anguilla anguilla TaxID=7936 RepID=A0A0E9RV27_ANGAN